MATGYATIIGVYSNVRDFKIQFRDTVPVTDEAGTITGQEISFDEIIAMSPTTAKELAIILAGQVEAFEKQYGEIKTFLMPPENTSDSNE